MFHVSWGPSVPEQRSNAPYSADALEDRPWQLPASLNGHGPPDVLEWKEVPVPEPVPEGQVRIKVRVSGVKLLNPI